MADAGRVIAGSARGLRLEAPGAGTRPLADRVKQTLFAILEPDLDGARVLDLFAGSGAAGIEALSRGAASATFVEHDAATTKVIAANLSRTGLAGPNAEVVREDVLRWLRRFDAEPFDVVIVGPRVAQGGRVVAKHFWRDTPPATVGLLASERDRRFGDTALTFYRRQEDR
jgi:16S rRNA (guanine966-N2)-methyltransferase